jgi:hypothetical protein
VTEVRTVDEVESFKASKESRREVLSRASRPGGYTDAVQRLVEAAFYRETHRTEGEPPTEDETDTADE